MKHPFFRSLLKRVIVIFVSTQAIVISIFVSLIIAGVLFAGVMDSDTSTHSDYEVISGDEMSSDKILSIPITGVILGDTSESSSAFPFLNEGVTFGYEVKEELMQAAENSEIKGVVLEINSPGGTIYGSRAIADGVAEYKNATGNPVYVFVAGLAASGGYMAAVTSDAIYADHGSTTGSIGVIYGPIKYYDTVISEGGLLEGEVLTQNGIESFYISAGKSKDMGNPYRQITNEERASLQAMVNSEYLSFVNFVSNNRDIEQAQLQNTIGALIYSNDVAQQYNLIDGTQNKQQTYTLLAKSKKLSEYQIIQKAPTYGVFESLLMGSGFLKQPSVSCKINEGILAYHGDVSMICGSSQDR